MLTFELLLTVCVLHIKLAAFDGCNVASPALLPPLSLSFFRFVYLLFLQHHVANELSLSQQPYSAALFNLPSSETEKCINSILIRKLAGNMQLTLIATRNETDSLKERERWRGGRGWRGISCNIQEMRQQTESAARSTFNVELPACLLVTLGNHLATPARTTPIAAALLHPLPLLLSPAAGWVHWLKALTVCRPTPGGVRRGPVLLRQMPL